MCLPIKFYNYTFIILNNLIILFYKEQFMYKQ